MPLLYELFFCATWFSYTHRHIHIHKQTHTQHREKRSAKAEDDQNVSFLVTLNVFLFELFIDLILATGNLHVLQEVHACSELYSI